MQTLIVTDLQRKIIDKLQIDIPLVPRPFATLGSELGMDEASLLSELQELLQRSLMIRLGPRFDPLTMGGGDVLLAFTVPNHLMVRFEALINYLPEIAHAHRREHELNVWCGIKTEQETGVDGTIQRIIHETGLVPQCFPKLVGFHRNGRKPSGLHPVAWAADPIDRKIILATQAGLPLVPHPYEEVGRWTGLTGAEVIERLRNLTAAGVIRCIVAVPNQQGLGLTENALCGWQVPASQTIEMGVAVARYANISRCSERAPVSDTWPYNLYAYVYGSSRAEIGTVMERLEREVIGEGRERLVMYSQKVIKKRGLRLTMRIH